MEESFQELLNKEIERRGLDDDQVARLIGVSRPTVVRWRSGTTQPHSAMRKAFLNALYDASHDKSS